MTEDERLRASMERAERTLAEVLSTIEPPKPEVPVSRSGPALSVLHSPHLLSWPPDVLEWLEDRVGEQGWRAVVGIRMAETGSR